MLWITTIWCHHSQMKKYNINDNYICPTSVNVTNLMFIINILIIVVWIVTEDFTVVNVCMDTHSLINVFLSFFK